MNEVRIVERIRQLAAASAERSSIVRGIGDDCAVIRPKANQDFVFTTDFVLEGRHFTLDTHKAADVGHKALARSLSDLAAMGSEPVFCLVSLAVPAELAGVWVNTFYKGLLALALSFNVALAGGDLASFDKVIVDVMCCGIVPRGKAILRSGAKPGDLIYVTGALGGSAAGLRLGRGPLFRRHIRPRPLVKEGTVLRRAGVSAAIDLSDGLSLDLHRLCVESRVGADLDHVPVARGATVEDALNGGEDYELLFTAPPKKKIPLRVTRIGTITPGAPGVVLLNGKRLQAKGFDHFASRQHRKS